MKIGVTDDFAACMAIRRAVFVEVKRPGARPRPLQVAVMARLEKAGARCLVYDGTTPAEDFVALTLTAPF